MSYAANDLERAERKSIIALATIINESGAECVAKVRNLARGGLAADALIPLAKDDRIVALLKDFGSVSGRVAWVCGGRFGMAFDVEIEIDAPTSGGDSVEHWKPLPMHRVGSNRSSRAPLGMG